MDSYWSSEEDSKVYAQVRPVVPKVFTDKLINFLTKSRALSECSLVVDVGCGPGTTTAVLRQQFPDNMHIDAFDLSDTQLDQARQRYRGQDITFRQHDCSTGLPYAADSVDVVTCIMALHWLPIDSFMRECKRVLKPGGVLAIGGYSLERFVVTEDVEYDDQFGRLFIQNYLSWIEAGWFEKRTRLSNVDEYRQVEMPFAECKDYFGDDVSLQVKQQSNFGQFLTMTKTRSGFIPWKKQEPDLQEFKKFEYRLKTLLPQHEHMNREQFLQFPITLIYPFYLRLSRKPL